MTFLKKLGQWIAKGVAVAGSLATGLNFLQPFLGSGALGTGKVATEVQTGLSDFEAVASLATQTEAIGATTGLTGAQKLQALVPLVKNYVQTSELVAGKKVADEATFEKGCTEIAQGMVDILNGLDASAAPAS